MEQGGKTVPTLGGDQKVGFAADTAASTGQTKRSINQHLARANALGDDALTKVANTSLDSGVELDATACWVSSVLAVTTWAVFKK